MTLEEYFGDWLKVIDSQELKSVVGKLNILYRQKPVCPAYADIFKCFHLCKYNDLRVVFIGQDPYPQKGVATGILFGNKAGTKELSPSLEVIKEACIDYTKAHYGLRFDDTLESWATQGILMLNSALTVEMQRVGSHTMLWRPFVSKLLQNLSEINPGLIYVLFGSQAQTFLPYINKNNIIIKVQHPAYFARTNTKMPNIFLEVNKQLKYHYGQTFKWFDEY